LKEQKRKVKSNRVEFEQEQNAKTCRDDPLRIFDACPFDASQIWLVKNESIERREKNSFQEKGKNMKT
jgi:hypothetical protein